MTFLRAIAREARQNTLGPGEVWAKDLVPVGGTVAGQRVSQESGSRLGAAYACIRFLSEVIGSLPLGAYRKVGGRVEQVSGPGWLENANLDLPWNEFAEQLLSSVLTDGNGYARILRNRLQLPAELIPLHPSEVSVKRASNGRPEFTVRGVIVPREDMLHVPAFVPPGGLAGVSPIEHCRRTFGLAQAAEEYGAAFFENGASPGGVIEHPGEATPERMKQLAQSWRRSHGGTKQAHMPGVLVGGASWKQVTIPNDQAQFLETRKMSRTEVAGIYRVPAHVIGDLERATFSNIEHQSIELVRYTLVPWLKRLENRLSPLLPRGQYVKVNVEGLLRGDTAARYRSYATARQWGWMNVDEIRELEDLSPLPDGAGEEYLVPQNMAPAGELEASDPITGGRQSGGDGGLDA